MALSKTSSAITQLTSSGTSTALNISAGIAPVLCLHHSNGTGSVTGAATAQVKFELNGAVRYYGPPELLITFGTGAAATEDRSVSVPDSSTSVEIVYTAPTGPTGFTLDAEVGITTP